jgi:hypothetical protein
MTTPLTALTFARDAYLADVIAHYVATVPSKVQSYKVQPCADEYIERVDLMFADNREARRFVNSLYEQTSWSFCGEAHVAKRCDYMVVVVVDKD